jgi:hypothetical protein
MDYPISIETWWYGSPDGSFEAVRVPILIVSKEEEDKMGTRTIQLPDGSAFTMSDFGDYEILTAEEAEKYKCHREHLGADDCKEPKCVCGSPAYLGLNTVECTNPDCIHYKGA